LKDLNLEEFEEKKLTRANIRAKSIESKRKRLIAESIKF
jgi:hypothetical protein